MTAARSAALAVVLLVVMAATVILGGAYPETLTTTDRAEPQSGAVSEQAMVCPVLAAGTDAAEAVTVFSAPAVPADQVAGAILGGSAGELPLPAPGAATTVTAAEPGGSVEVLAQGASAGRTAAVRTWLDSADEGRGLAMEMCPQLRAEWWFVGVSALTGQIDELLLANPTGSPAVVDVEVFGSTGRVEVLGVGGVVLQPGASSAIRIDSLIPGSVDATLRVATSGGLVAAAVRSTAIDGLIPQGAEYLPPALPPSTSLVVPGVLAGAGPRNLVVTAGDQDAAVEVTLLTAEGPRGREGGGLIPVPAGTTVTVDIADDLRGEAAAVQLEGSAAVTAAVRSVLPGAVDPAATGVLSRVPVADMAWTSAQQPITDRWLLPIAGVPEAAGGVLLSSVGGDAEVEVIAMAADGTTFRESVAVPEDGLREVAIPVASGAATVVELVVSGDGNVSGDGKGKVHAASFQSGTVLGGPVAAAANGQNPSAAVQLPPAYPDPQVLSSK